MSRGIRGRRAVRAAVASVASVGLLVATAVPAGAHASVLAQFPTDGAAVEPWDSPTEAGIDFSEAVSVDPAGIALRDGSGALLTGAASAAAGSAAEGGRVAATSSAPLTAGSYAVETSVVSKDGHRLVRAWGFSVGPAPSAPGLAPVVLAAAPTSGSQPPLSVELDASSVGARTVRVRVPDGVTGGELRLQCRRGPGERVPKVRVPFIWTLGAPDAGMSDATGYLPVPCRYTLRLTLARPFPATPLTYVTSAEGALEVTG